MTSAASKKGKGDNCTVPALDDTKAPVSASQTGVELVILGQETGVWYCLIMMMVVETVEHPQERITDFVQSTEISVALVKKINCQLIKTIT